jgi:hypothetical protein
MTITDQELARQLGAVRPPTSVGLDQLAATAIRRGRSQRRRRRAVESVAGVLAALVVGGSVLQLGHGSGAAPSAETTRLLLQLADHTAALPDHTTTAPYWYVERAITTTTTDGTGSGATTNSSTAIEHLWLGNDRRSRDVWVPPLGDGTDEIPFSLTLPDDTRLSWKQFAQLPTDPPALRKFLNRHATSHNSNPPDNIRWGMIGSMLGESPASPALRAAVYRVAAGLPDTRATTGHDSLGRPALIITYAHPDSAPYDSYYVSPSTGMLLEEVDQGIGVQQQIVYRAAGPVKGDHVRGPEL